jgi:hypothetical protein
MKDPVCPLLLALYGHPDSGGYWEKHCNTHLGSVGFVPVPEWRSCFFHPKLGLYLTVYVDDFKMSGEAKALKKGWEMIRTKIQTEEPTPLGKYLGCTHKIMQGTMPAGGNPRITPGPETPKVTKRVPVKVVEYDMSDFLVSCVDKYLELAKLTVNSLKFVETPYLDETTFPGIGDIVNGEVKTPVEGALKLIASRILMKILYAARMFRYDLLRAVSALARFVSRWTVLQDKMLHRLVCYIHHSLDRKMYGWIGDARADLKVTLFADADFAGDTETTRSTSGVFLALTGPNSFFPISALSKRQSCVSHSTPEAELVAADLAIRTEGIPALGSLVSTVEPREAQNRLPGRQSDVHSSAKNGEKPNNATSRTDPQGQCGMASRAVQRRLYGYLLLRQLATMRRYLHESL